MTFSVRKKKEKDDEPPTREALRIGGVVISVDEYSPGGPPLDITIETRLNLITGADRVILSVKIAACGSRHLRQDPACVYSKGLRRAKGADGE